MFLISKTRLTLTGPPAILGLYAPTALSYRLQMFFFPIWYCGIANGRCMWKWRERKKGKGA